MDILQYQDIEKLLKTGEISYYNVYNCDTQLQTFYSTKYYDNNTHDTVEKAQPLRTLFLDIEVFTDNQGFDSDNFGAQPINAITLNVNNSKTYKAYYLLLDKNYKNFGIKDQMEESEYNELINQKIKSFKERLFEGGYINSLDEIDIEIHIYTDEGQLLTECWQEIHRIDPPTLSGFNSDNFDYPYIYYRLCNLFGNDNTHQIMSKFGHVTVKNNRIYIPEFSIMDIMYLYKPRDEGGLLISPHKTL